MLMSREISGTLISSPIVFSSYRRYLHSCAYFSFALSRHTSFAPPVGMTAGGWRTLTHWLRSRMQCASFQACQTSPVCEASLFTNWGYLFGRVSSDAMAERLLSAQKSPKASWDVTLQPRSNDRFALKRITPDLHISCRVPALLYWSLMKLIGRASFLVFLALSCTSWILRFSRCMPLEAGREIGSGRLVHPDPRR